MQVTDIAGIFSIVVFICIGVLGFIGYQSEPETSVVNEEVVNEESTTWSTID